jgi:hypothetical protein
MRNLNLNYQIAAWLAWCGGDPIEPDLGNARPLRLPNQAVAAAGGLDGNQMARYQYAGMIKVPATRY